ncbi:CvpA family protein [Lignipirellula cremea]|uniref:Colicin V production protein n=1 Tax=Lignipirellula cremea TaxID=2528010 RepID=A0A518E2Y8_9BACT|nr:CvpA family protein [Lignipirellula cremea]QDU98451.1 Colicin V production protein [Lignipirellula cremea]
MQIYDMIMLAVLLAAVLFGFWKGLAWQIASLSAVFLSYFVSYQFRDVVAAQLGVDEKWNSMLAMLILYVGTSLLVWLGFRVVKNGLNRMKLKEFDSQLGATLGAVKGGILCLIITFFALTLLSDAQKHQVCCSYSGYVMGRTIDRLNVLLPEEAHAAIGPYLDRLDQELEHDHSGHILAEETKPILPGLPGVPALPEQLTPNSQSGQFGQPGQFGNLQQGIDAAREAKAALDAVEATFTRQR